LDKPVDSKRKLLSWSHLAVLTIYAIYAYVFLEWLFYITKPSFMDLMPIEIKTGLFLFFGLILFLLCLPVLLLTLTVSFIPRLSKFWKVILKIASALPAVFIAFTTLMLIDNFTYTVFRFGVVSSKDYQRGLYAVFFILLFLGAWWWMSSIMGKQSHKKRWNTPIKVQLTVCAVLLLGSMLLGVNLYLAARQSSSALEIRAAGTIKRPNILLIGTDGLNAENMSLYGYSRPTTPFLQEFAKSTLLAENNFSNATQTAGSMVSLFTSRLTTDTRMLYPPDILRGTNSILHLPGILQKENYYNAEISVDYYADMTALNMQNSFVMENGRSTYGGRVYETIHRFAPDDAAYFMSTIFKRLSDRLMHIFYLRTMVNPYAEATQKLNTMSDKERLDFLFSQDLFNGSRSPLFVHVHMMGTHEGMYITPLNETFSKNEPSNDSSNPDFYDDAILDFDNYMKEVVTRLTELNKLDDTIIIIYTDHGKDGDSHKRLPLLIRFPQGEHAGLIKNNTQNLDIAPTILDYMGINQPTWMTGTSLLKGEPPAVRPIFSAVPNLTTHNENGRKVLDLNNQKPPFYQFGSITMTICQNLYSLDTTSFAWQESKIDNYPTPCPSDTMPDQKQAQQIMIDQLQKNGFDTSSLQGAIK
jgi:hypothetical protein